MVSFNAKTQAYTRLITSSLIIGLSFTACVESQLSNAVEPSVDMAPPEDPQRCEFEGAANACFCPDGELGTQLCQNQVWTACVCEGDVGPDMTPCETAADCQALDPQVSFVCSAQSVCEPVDYSPAPSEVERVMWDIISGSASEDSALAFGEEVSSFCEVTNYSNGPNSGTGHFVGSSIYGYQYQCTEYAFRFICEHYNVGDCRGVGKNNQPYGNAKQWWANEANHPVLALLERYPNNGTEKPRAGDIMVFGNGTYGHVAIVREVFEDRVALIEQNVTGTTQDGYHVHRLNNTNGIYGVSQALGWLRAPNSQAACGQELPNLITPQTEERFLIDEEVSFSWELGDPSANHFLKVRHLDSDQVTVELNLGLMTSAAQRFGAVGEYRWTVYYQSDECPDGQCAAVARTFRVEAPSEECRPEAYQSCQDGSVYWYDSCDQRGALVEACAEGEVCVNQDEGPSCQTPDPNCEAQSYQACHENAVYWYDSCDQRGDLITACGANEACERTGDTASCDSTCTDQSYQDCENNTGYWYNSCDERGELVRSCGMNETCARTGDTVSCMTTCQDQDRQGCYNGDVYWYNSCNVRGSLYRSCGSNEECVSSGDSASCVSTCECSSGACCDGCNYRSSSYTCDSNLRTEYRCSSTMCGGDPQRRVIRRKCSGSSSSCNGAEDPQSWTNSDTCNDFELCQSSNSSSASCSSSCSYGCTGSSCDSTPCCTCCRLTPSPSLNQWTSFTSGSCPNIGGGFLYQLRVTNISYTKNGDDVEARATIQVRKNDGSAPSSTVRIELVTAGEGQNRMQCDDRHAYFTRASGTWSAGQTTYTFNNVSIWPNAECSSLASGADKTLGVITGGGGGFENDRIWMSSHVLTFTRGVCQ